MSSLLRFHVIHILASTICNNEYCKNFGNCEQNGPDAICDCRHGFGGVACEDGNYCRKFCSDFIAIIQYENIAIMYYVLWYCCKLQAAFYRAKFNLVAIFHTF